MMKTAIIVPYFGTLPNYFQLFLDSCKYNSGFEWLIFSNDQTPFRYPDNVHFYPMSFSDCRELVQSKFDFEISLPAPQKLCDYKPAYGFIFQDYLNVYDWWGHCDLDQIFGDLGAFITREMLETYDKIGSLGHLSLYRNMQENNRVFYGPRSKEVFTAERGQAFDEWLLPGNINEIYLSTEHKSFLDNFGADVNPYHTAFQLVDYNVSDGAYHHSAIKHSVFLWEHGKLTQFYNENNQLQSKAFPYIHLQKRAMKDRRKIKNSDAYFIVPNQFVDNTTAPEQLLKRTKLRCSINTQFIKVKFKSLRYRLNSGDWTFNNAFRK